MSFGWEAELLASIIAGGPRPGEDPVAVARAVVDADMFGGREHRTIWESVVRLHDAGDPVTASTVVVDAEESLRPASAVEWVSGLVDIAVSAEPSYVLRRARRVRDGARLRAAGGLADRIRAVAGSEEGTVEDRLRRVTRIWQKGMDLGGFEHPAVTCDWPESLDDIPRREWLVPGWIPRGCLTLMPGVGAGGKSLACVQLMAAVAGDEDCVRRVFPAGDEWCASTGADAPTVRAEAGVAVLASWEDDVEETARRRLRIRCPWDLGDRFRHVAMRNLGAIWGPGVGSSHVATTGESTPLGDQLQRLLASMDPAPSLVVLDPLAAAYGSDENVRTLVRPFISALDEWAAEVGCAFVIVSHPAKAADSVYSGSTDWRNGPRSVTALEAAPTRFKAGRTAAPGRRLRLDKANYAEAGKQVWLRMVREYSEFEDRTTKLRWEECTEWESAVAHAERMGLPLPDDPDQADA